MAPTPDVFVIRINIPSLNLQKAIRINSTDVVFSLKKQLEDKVASEIKDILNYGVYLHGKEGKRDKFLDERNTIGSYHIDGNSQIDFILKCKIGGEAPNSKTQKKVLEDIQKGNLDKVREKTTKTFDFNYLVDQETPIAAAVMNNDPEMILWLMDNGAFLDYRVGDKEHWKTPLHVAAQNNKSLALKTLIQYGAWINAKDTLGNTPLYYACTHGNTECVLRLLLAKADTEVFDKYGRSCLHQAVLNNFDCIVAILLDFGANIETANASGNTSLHVAASRNAKESAKWLLLRGADKEKKNKSGKTPCEVALQSKCTETFELIANFSASQISTTKLTIVPPPSTRVVVEYTDVDAVVQNVLNSLSSSIGKEYNPQLFISRRSKGATSPARKIVSLNDLTSSARNSASNASSTVSLTADNSSNNLQSPLNDNSRQSAGNLSSSVVSPEEKKPILKSFSKSNSYLSNKYRPSGLGTTSWLPPDADTKSETSGFETAWEKIASNESPTIKLKHFIMEKGEGKDLIMGLETLEDNFVQAISKYEMLKQENESLLVKLKELESK